MSLDVYLKTEDEGYVFDWNVTHNLGKMAREAGLYEVLWRPDENDFETAEQMLPVLKEGLLELVCNEGHYSTFNPENGWGSYEGLVKFVAKYLNACSNYPHATVEVSR